MYNNIRLRILNTFFTFNSICICLFVFCILYNLCNSFMFKVCRCVVIFLDLLIFVIVNSISHLSNLYLSRSIHIKKLPKTTNLSINFIWPLNIYIRIMCTHCKRQRSYIQYDNKHTKKQYNNQQRLIYNGEHKYPGGNM